MVNIQKCALCTFKKDVTPFIYTFMHQIGCVANKRLEGLNCILKFIHKVVCTQQRFLIKVLEGKIYVFEILIDLCSQCFAVQQVDHSDPDAGYFTHIGRTNTSAGGTNSISTPSFFL